MSSESYDLCDQCELPGKFICGGCGYAIYCSKECQLNEWITDNHEEICYLGDTVESVEESEESEELVGKLFLSKEERKARRKVRRKVRRGKRRVRRRGRRRRRRLKRRFRRKTGKMDDELEKGESKLEKLKRKFKKKQYNY